MSGPTAVLFCPGRGSYGRAELGTLAATLRPGGEVAAALALADAARREAAEPTVSELDGASRFRASQHLDGRNAAELIYFCSMAHVERLRERYQVVAVAGNSLGWYTALPAAGALSVEDGWQLVRTMARLQARVDGGQVLTSCVGEDWRIDPEARWAVGEVVEAVRARGADHFVWPSIRLGGHEVIAGTEAGVGALLRELPARTVGKREFPFRLAGHGPFHTPLCEPVAVEAEAALASLRFRRPAVAMIDGRGDVVSPWSSDPQAILHYTARTQVVETFDFTAAVRTAIREYCPEVLVCVGPGESLRAPVGHVVLAEGYRGLRAKPPLFDSGLIAVE